MTSKTVLITGGAGGIGREFTKLYAEDGYQIIVVSLLQDELDELERELSQNFPSISCHFLQMDLSEKDAAESVVQWCEEKSIEVDVLINNVGFGLLGEHVEIDPVRIEAMLAVNNLLLTKLTRYFGAKMKERRSGAILNVASLVAFSPSPLFTAYSATKAYTLAFSVGVARELEAYGVTVTCLCPGTTKTGFVDAAQTGVKSAGGITKFVQAYQVTPDVVARAGYRGLQKGKLLVMPNLFLHIQAIFLRLLPMSLVSWFVYKKTK